MLVPSLPYGPGVHNFTNLGQKFGNFRSLFSCYLMRRECFIRVSNTSNFMQKCFSLLPQYIDFHFVHKLTLVCTQVGE